MKGYGLPQIKFPSSLNTFMSDQPLAWGTADFFKTGEIDVFTAKQNYRVGDQATDPLAATWAQIQANPARYASDLQFWKRDPSTGVLTLALSYKGCLHPRKGLVADFNQDGFPDVFVACHGYDGDADPTVAGQQLAGEKSIFLLNDGQGGFALSQTKETTFFHGASAADVNGDGWPDIVVADIFNFPTEIYFLINNKDGTFTKDTSRVHNLPGNSGPYFAAELVDVDGDGIVDLIVGGHEYDPNCPSCLGAQTTVLYGKVDGTFGDTKEIIPTVAGQGISLDFTLGTNATGQRVIYVDRTADGSGEPVYSTQFVQQYNLVTKASTELFHNVGRWFAWMLPIAGGVSPHNENQPVSILGK